MNRKRSLLICLTVCFSLTACLQAHGQSSDAKQDYIKSRQRLIRSEKSLNPASVLVMSAAEKKANSYLERLQQQEIERTRDAFPPAHNFFLIKSEIDKSPLLPIFKKMPKGAVLHAHPGALGDFRWLIAYATYLPNCYKYTGPDRMDAWLPNGSLAFHQTPPDSDWHLVSELRAAAPDKVRFDDELYQSLTLGVEDLPAKTADLPTFDIWPEFEKCFARADGLQGYLPVYREFFRRELEVMASENVQELELRAFLGGPADLHGHSAGNEAAIAEYRQYLKEVRQKYPDFQLKLIFTFARSAPPAVIAERLKTALALRKKHPDIVVGFDLVNEEDPRKDKPHPLIDFLDLFLQTARDARTQGTTLPYFFHAGETNKTENENVYDALLLNSRRIGHGLALIKHPHLLDLVRRRGIAVEACPISNQVLGYIPDLRNHPGVHWLRSGIPVTINPDDPGMMGYTFSYDFYEVFMAWDLNLADLKQLAMNSLQHSALNPEEKKSAMKSWRVKWGSWVDWLNSQAGNR